MHLLRTLRMALASAMFSALNMRAGFPPSMVLPWSSCD